MNILDERDRCRRECSVTHWRSFGSVRFGDARQCEHGRWWVATGREVEGRFFNALDAWRLATRRERRRARRLATTPTKETTDE